MPPAVVTTGLNRRAAAFTGYVLVLSRIDNIALAQRDTLTEQLCKT